MLYSFTQGEMKAYIAVGGLYVAVPSIADRNGGPNRVESNRNLFDSSYCYTYTGQ